MAIETEELKVRLNLRLNHSLLEFLEQHVDRESRVQLRDEAAAALGEARARWRREARELELLIQMVPSIDANRALEQLQRSVEEGVVGDRDVHELSTTLAQLILGLRIDALEELHDQLQYSLARWREDIPDISDDLAPLVLATRRVLERAVTPEDLRLILGSEQGAEFLQTLVAEPGLDTAALADRLNVHDSAISRTGRQLLERELVYTRAIGRHHVWELTPRGESVAAAVSHQIDPSNVRNEGSGTRRLEQILELTPPLSTEREPDIVNAASAVVGDSLLAADAEDLHRIARLLKERTEPGLSALSALARSGEAVLRGAGGQIQLDPWSVDILGRLRSGYWTTGQLAEATMLSENTLRKVARDLERGGAVTRIDAGRSKPWRITPIGIAALDAESPEGEEAAIALRCVGSLIRDEPVRNDGVTVLAETFDAVRSELPEADQMSEVDTGEIAIPLGAYRVGIDLIDSSQQQLVALGAVSPPVRSTIG